MRNAIKYKGIRRAALTLTLLAVGGVIRAAGLSLSAPGAVQLNEASRAAECSACHGAEGMGQAAGGIPRLAGLNAAYLTRQLDDFVSGTRRSSVMAPIAKALRPDQRQALAAYYSKLPVSVWRHSHAPRPPAANDLGEQLAARGLWSKQVPGCVQCHGPHGVGVGQNFPPLAGQPALYIADQLHAWQDGARRNDPLGLMRHVASALNEKDIRAVAEWFAAQPIKRKAGAR